MGEWSSRNSCEGQENFMAPNWRLRCLHRMCRKRVQLPQSHFPLSWKNERGSRAKNCGKLNRFRVKSIMFSIHSYLAWPPEIAEVDTCLARVCENKWLSILIRSYKRRKSHSELFARALNVLYVNMKCVTEQVLFLENNFSSLPVKAWLVSYFQFVFEN